MTYSFCTISEVDPVKGLARVEIADLGGIVSDWLQVLAPKTKTDKFIWSPEIGEFVFCIFDKNYTEGIILGSVYTSENEPSGEDGVLQIQFGDGAIISYNRNTSKLTVDVTNAGEVNIIAKDVNISCTNATITASDSVDVNSPVLSVSGEIRAGGDVVAGYAAPVTRVRLLTHTHTSPVGPTGPPTPTP